MHYILAMYEALLNDNLIGLLVVHFIHRPTYIFIYVIVSYIFYKEL